MTTPATRSLQAYALLRAHAMVAYGTIKLAGDLTICQGEAFQALLDQGDAYQLQVDLLLLGVKAVEAAEEISRRHPGLEEWRQGLEVVGRELDAFQDALVRPEPSGATPDPDDGIEQATETILEKVDQQLFLGEYAVDNCGDAEKLTPHGRAAVREFVEAALRAAAKAAEAGGR